MQPRFDPCDEKRGNGTSCDKWNDRRKTQEEKTARKEAGWLNAGRVTDVLKATSDRNAWKVMIAYLKRQGTGLVDEHYSIARLI